MPELPEVETICRGLAPLISNRHIIEVCQRRATLRFPFPRQFAARLKGRTIRHITRRGKFILIHLDKELVWLVHLGMSGRFRLWPPTAKRPNHAPASPHAHGDAHAPTSSDAHDHLSVRLDNNAVLVYTDPRRFGYMDLLAADSSDTLARSKHFIRMGPEPLSNGFNADILSKRLAKRKRAIKTALLDQTIIAGLGNIYACESLFRARISPRRLACNLGQARIGRLVPALRNVLQDAIDAGGTTLRDFASIDGQAGYFQYRFDVYDRANLPCPNKHCDATIARIVQSGRASFFCPACQR